MPFKRYKVIKLFYAQNQKLNRCSCFLGLRLALITFNIGYLFTLFAFCDVKKKKLISTIERKFKLLARFSVFTSRIHPKADV